ncbi:hypothetical protein [Pontibacter mangrovi]|uniref:Uncharacterized protein n=1 Tax=Pontibacter mangrovi TaxID=2589816 RepID=A0A501VSX7_9BACT|nr:hypothetical protein [Pontibacter mangrovi]TPE40649.1 hypothetical protein FJM65_20135 [Pontibacter mangrovi]
MSIVERLLKAVEAWIGENSSGGGRFYYVLLHTSSFRNPIRLIQSHSKIAIQMIVNVTPGSRTEFLIVSIKLDAIIVLTDNSIDTASARIIRAAVNACFFTGLSPTAIRSATNIRLLKLFVLSVMPPPCRYKFKKAINAT